MKTALIKAVSACPEDPVIRECDMIWGKAVAEICASALLTKAELHMADNLTEANTKKVLRIVLSAGTRGVPLEVISQRTRNLKSAERQDILNSLRVARDIKMGLRYSPGPGRPGAVYFDARLPTAEGATCTE
jgi:hypothetical protein